MAPRRLLRIFASSAPPPSSLSPPLSSTKKPASQNLNSNHTTQRRLHYAPPPHHRLDSSRTPYADAAAPSSVRIVRVVPPSVVVIDDPAQFALVVQRLTSETPTPTPSSSVSSLRTCSYGHGADAEEPISPPESVDSVVIDPFVGPAGEAEAEEAAAEAAAEWDRWINYEEESTAELVGSRVVLNEYGSSSSRWMEDSSHDSEEDWNNNNKNNFSSRSCSPGLLMIGGCDYNYISHHSPLDSLVDDDLQIMIRALSYDEPSSAYHHHFGDSVLISRSHDQLCAHPCSSEIK